MLAYLYILGTIVFTVYGQIILKFEIIKYGSMPENFTEAILFIFKLFLNPLIISGFISALIASMFWMAAMTKFELTKAYPFMSLNFILVLFVGAIFLGESITISKLVGLLLIVVGLIIVVR